MAMLSQPSFHARAALVAITFGALLTVWTVDWYFAFAYSAGPMSNHAWFWFVGFLLTGIGSVAMGFLIGPIGRSARRAELPPAQAMPTEARIQQTAAAVPHPVAAPTAGIAPPPVQPAPR